MKRYKCGACWKSFLLAKDLQPFICEECDLLLCPMCAESGCCEPIGVGDVECSSCTKGMVEVAGECMACGGLGCYIENQITRECLVCGGRGWPDVSLCVDCGGYSWIFKRSARRLKRKSA